MRSAKSKAVLMAGKAMVMVMVAAMVMSVAGAAWAATFFERVYNLGTNWGNGGVVQNADGSFFLYGTYSIPDPPYYFATVAKLSAAGDFAWAKDFHPLDGGLGSAANGISKTADGGAVIVWTPTNQTSTTVAKIDANGYMVWQRQITGTGFQHVLVDGNILYLSTGNDWQDPTGKPGVDILKIDMGAMSILWNKSFTLAANGCRMQALRRDLDGGLLLTGWVDTSATAQDGIILKISTAGAVVASKKFTLAGNQWIHDIVPLATSTGAADGYAFAGYTNSLGAGQEDVWVGKLSTAWATKWQKAMGGCNSDWTYSIAQLNNLSIQVSATISSLANEAVPDVWGINLSSSNTWRVNWQKRYWTLGQDEGYGLTKTNDGGMALLGGDSLGQSALFIKTDNTGAILSQTGCANPATIACPSVTATTSTVTTITGNFADFTAVLGGVYDITFVEQPFPTTDTPVSVDKFCHN